MALLCQALGLKLETELWALGCGWNGEQAGVGGGGEGHRYNLFLKAASSSRATRPQMELDLSPLLNSCEIIVAFD